MRQPEINYKTAAEFKNFERLRLAENNYHQFLACGLVSQTDDYGTLESNDHEIAAELSD